MFDPASLFSPSQLSSLTSTSVEPSPQLTMSTRRRAQLECYVVPPRLSPSTKELYQQLPDYLGGDPEFVRNDLDAVVGEYPLDSQSKPSHYFVRFKDGLARRVSHSSLLPSPFSKLNFLRYLRVHSSPITAISWTSIVRSTNFPSILLF